VLELPVEPHEEALTGGVTAGVGVLRVHGASSEPIAEVVIELVTGELKNPSKDLGRAVMVGVVVLAATYVMAQFAETYVATVATHRQSPDRRRNHGFLVDCIGARYGGHKGL
jgi:amino acid transporter